MEMAELLKKVYLFRDMEEDELEELASLAKSCTFYQGDVIFREGDTGDSIYVIRLGSVKIVKADREGNESQVAILGTGSHFGEMTVADRQPRSATVIANEHTKLIKFDVNDLDDLFEKHPEIGFKFYRKLSMGLSRRLRNTTEDLSFTKQLLSSRHTQE